MLHPCRRWGSSSLPSRGEDPHGHSHRKNHPYFVFELTLTDLGNTFLQVSDYPLPSDSSGHGHERSPLAALPLPDGATVGRGIEKRPRPRQTGRYGLYPCGVLPQLQTMGKQLSSFKGEKILTEGGLFPIPGTDGNGRISE